MASKRGIGDLFSGRRPSQARAGSDTWDYEAIDRFLESNIRVAGFPDEMATRIDFLESLVAVLRWRHSHLKPLNHFENFLSCEVTADGALECRRPDGPGEFPGYTPALLLQPDLLIFLMLNDREDCPILDCIEEFVNHEYMRRSLTVADFKKLHSGAIRCFTNTRFAATRLRAAGFLRFTKKEAHKSWRLTLSGYAQAALVLMQGYDRDVCIPFMCVRGLHPDIANAWDRFDVYRSIVHNMGRNAGQGGCNTSEGVRILRAVGYLLDEYRPGCQPPKRDSDEERIEEFKRRFFELLPLEKAVLVWNYQNLHSCMPESEEKEVDHPETPVAPLAPDFSEETYQKALPHFKKAYSEIIKSGRALADFLNWVFEEIGYAARPYLSRFINDLQRNALAIGECPQMTEYQLTNEDRATPDWTAAMTHLADQWPAKTRALLRQGVAAMIAEADRATSQFWERVVNMMEKDVPQDMAVEIGRKEILCPENFDREKEKDLSEKEWERVRAIIDKVYQETEDETDEA